MLPRLALVLGLLVAATATTIIIMPLENETKEGPNNVLALVSPSILVAKAQTTGIAFPENEAGISAYLRPTTSINLTLAKSAFATVDEETSGYIKGTVAVAGMTEDEYPYMWVSSDGWIIAYIPRDYKSEALIAPFGYNFPTTTLAEAIKKVCSAIGASFDYNQVGYYHFKFPDANGMVVALERGCDEFFVYINKSVKVYNISWFLYSTYGSSFARLDGREFVRGYHIYGFFSESEFEKGIDHNVRICANPGFGLVIVYRK